MRLYDFLLGSTVAIYRFIFRPNLHRVRCLVFHRDSLLLVQHAGFSQEWTLPGGGMKKGEAAVATAEREMLEEMKLELNGSIHVGNTYLKKRLYSLQVELVLSRVESDLLRPERLEIREAAWFSLEQLPSKRSQLVDKALKVCEASIAKL